MRQEPKPTAPTDPLIDPPAQVNEPTSGAGSVQSFAGAWAARVAAQLTTGQLAATQPVATEPHSKIRPTETISKVVVGAKDPFGYTITDVISRANEYAIYEIDRPDISETLRVIYEGYTPESEKSLQQRFNKVKEKYTEAKGLAYRSSSYGLMRHRVAATLSTALSSDQPDLSTSIADFDRLIATIKKEDEDRIEHRAAYLAPAGLATVLWAVVAVVEMPLRLTPDLPYWQLISAGLASLLGGSMSILISARKLNFEEYASGGFYFMLGVERVLLALAAGGIAVILLKSGWILSAIKVENYWAMMAILIAAAFSESMIPSALQKIEGGTRVAEKK